MVRATRDPEGRKRLIIEAAAELMIELGLPAISHRKVAERAGVPLGSTTQYFKTLDDLLIAALGQLTSEYAAHLSALSKELGDTKSPAGVIASYLLSYANDTDRARAEAAFFFANLGSPAMREIADEWYTRQHEILAEHLDERAAAAVGTYADGLYMQIARGDQAPDADDLTWVITQLIDHTTAERDPSQT